MLLALALRLEEPALRRSATSACSSGSSSSGIRFRVAGAEHMPLDRAAVFCSNHQSNIDPPVLFDALHPRMHILYKHEIDQIPDSGARVPAGRLHSDRSPQQGVGHAVHRGGRAIDPLRQFVPDFSRRDAQQDRRRCCRSRRAASSWRSRRRRRSCRSRFRAAGRPCGAAAGSSAGDDHIRVGPADRNGGLSLDERDELIVRVRRSD